MPHVDLPQAEFKVVLLGDTFTGKTSLVLRFAEGYYRESARSATVGAFFITKRLTVPSTGLTCKIQIWDTAGQEQFKPLAPMYYQSAAAAILCYDPTSSKSLETLKYWLDELHRNVPAGRIVIAMAACKCDLIAQQPTTAGQSTQDTGGQSQSQQYPSPNKLQLAVAGLQEVEDLAAHMGAIFVPTSAKNNDNVTELFAQVAERVLQYRQNNANNGDIPVTMGGSNSNSRPSSPTQAPHPTVKSHYPPRPKSPPSSTHSLYPPSPNHRPYSPNSNNHHARYSSTSLHSTATAPTSNQQAQHGAGSPAGMNREDYLHRRNHHHSLDLGNIGGNGAPNSPSRLYTTTDPMRMKDSPILAAARSPTNSVQNSPENNKKGNKNSNHNNNNNSVMCGDADFLNCAAGDHNTRCVIL